MGIRLRFVVVVVILGVAAIAAGLMMFSRLRSSNETEATHVPVAPAPHSTKKPTKPGPVTLVNPPPAAALPTPKPKPTPSVATPPAAAQPAPTEPSIEQTQSGLPAAVVKELQAGRVVVVSLYAPKAKVDDTAMREASAGAALAGAAFVKVDVTKSAIDGLNRRYGVLQDPAVLVLRPPGDLIVRIDGFADRDTVAQAAANAAQ
jgi:hypothetical protein